MDPPAERRANRFLTAFSSVEKSLQRISGIQRRAPFFEMLELAKRRSTAVRHYEVDLKELADLRNAIVHERTGERPIADPYEDTVTELERISEALANPPLVIQVMGTGGVETVSPERPIGEAAQQMAGRDFSQLPVYADDHYVGMLTTEAITKWLAKQFEGGIGLAEEELVSVVLEFAQEQACKFVHRDATVFDAIRMFDEAAIEGVRLEALLVTHGGDPRHKPLAIVTIFDLPKLHGAARPPAT